MAKDEDVFELALEFIFLVRAAGLFLTVGAMTVWIFEARPPPLTQLLSAFYLDKLL